MRDNWPRDSLLRALAALGMHAVTRTARADLEALVRSLRPQRSGVDLVRLGPAGDGGYLVPDDLDGIGDAFSPGVSTESGFEAALAERGLQVFLADHSVDRPGEMSSRFVFDKRHLGAVSNDIYMTLDEWKNRYLPDERGDLILQMDIEGGEFEALMAASPELMAQFRIMVVEFHYLHQLLNKPWFILVARVFAKLLETHEVVHIHPNNCCGSVAMGDLVIPRVAEFTFYRKDRFRERGPCRTFPHPLDADNTRKRPLVLPKCWYE